MVKPKSLLFIGICLLIAISVLRPGPAAAGWQPIRVLSELGTDAANPSLVAHRNQVYALWTIRFWHDDFTVLVRRSRDGGLTWEKPRAVRSNIDLSARPQLAVSLRDSPRLGRPETVLNVFTADSLGLYFQESRDGGRSWSFPRLLDSRSFESMAVVGEGRSVHLVAATRDELYYWRSEDGGATWWAPAEIELATDLSVFLPRVASAGQRIYLAWSQEVGTRDWGTYFASSLDGGLTWSGPRRMSAGEFAGFVTIAAKGNRVGAVWSESGICGSGYRFVSQISADRGETWSEPRCVSSSEAGASNPSMVMHRGGLRLIYDLSVSEGLRYTESFDAGLTWSRAVIVGRDVERGVIAADRRKIHIAWTGRRRISYRQRAGEP